MAQRCIPCSRQRQTDWAFASSSMRNAASSNVRKRRWSGRLTGRCRARRWTRRTCSIARWASDSSWGCSRMVRSSLSSGPAMEAISECCCPFVILALSELRMQMLPRRHGTNAESRTSPASSQYSLVVGALGCPREQAQRNRASQTEDSVSRQQLEDVDKSTHLFLRTRVGTMRQGRDGFGGISHTNSPSDPAPRLRSGQAEGTRHANHYGVCEAARRCDRHSHA
jgi:hypothetical protein